MKLHVVFTLFIGFASLPAIAAEQSLSEVVFEAGLQHIKQHGPDYGAEPFIGYTYMHAWPRRREVVAILEPHLKSKNPEAVSGTLRAFYRLRFLGEDAAAGPEEEEAVTKFCNEIDEMVYGKLEHLFTLEDDRVLKSLALFCGWPTAAEAKRTLLRIIQSSHAKNAKEQALICLAWHRNPSDMETLLPYMLEDSHASRSLPYHFRNSYGEASIPYMKKAISEAAWTTTRLESAFQLVHLRDKSGFQHLHSVLEGEPEADGKRSRPTERIRAFAWDYLEFPRDSKSSAAIAEHILMKQRELCTRE